MNQVAVCRSSSVGLARIGEQRWWAKKITRLTTTPSASCGWWKRSKAWCAGCSFYGARRLFGHKFHLIHHPCKTDGVLCSVETRRV